MCEGVLCIFCTCHCREVFREERDVRTVFIYVVSDWGYSGWFVRWLSGWEGQWQEKRYCFLMRGRILVSECMWHPVSMLRARRNWWWSVRWLYTLLEAYLSSCRCEECIRKASPPPFLCGRSLQMTAKLVLHVNWICWQVKSLGLQRWGCRLIS